MARKMTDEEVESRKCFRERVGAVGRNVTIHQDGSATYSPNTECFKDCVFQPRPEECAVVPARAVRGSDHERRAC